MEAIEYEMIAGALSMLKFLIAAEDDIKNDRLTDVEDFFRKFRCDKEIVD